jgi:hypothetical protein
MNFTKIMRIDLLRINIRNVHYMHNPAKPEALKKIGSNTVLCL